MTHRKLDILVLSDLHYIDKASHTGSIGKRNSFLGPLLIQKALQRLAYQNIRLDLMVILGDVVDNGDADGAEIDLAGVAHTAQDSGLPILALPGNHDGDAERFARIFGCHPGLHEINGYGLVLFHDSYAPDDTAARQHTELAQLKKIHAARPDLPLIALQHNPIHPHIESDYPYMLANADQVRTIYNESIVILSLSGHYHRGQPPHRVGNTMFYAAPAACEAPFIFSHVQVDGNDIRIHEHKLQMDVPGLTDVHCHTEYAYCGTTVTAEKDIRIAESMGIGKMYIVEHTFQLYFNQEDAWSYRWQTDQNMAKAGMTLNQGRMSQFKRFIRQFKSDYVGLGFEVDLCEDGSLLLADADRDGWDILLGAIHNIPGCAKGKTSQQRAEVLFLKETERLLEHPIQVLAHPFRFFRRMALAAPIHLYGTVAEMLARSGIAAEINFHTNEPDPRFIEECISRGVKIALGSDSHDLKEVGEFYPHLKVLERAGVTETELLKVLFRPH
ncbi:metallophosphoesterase [candidate division KSB1 bacterium]|nr:metallophosphoesterase [candidate division KSB1 bacterium]